MEPRPAEPRANLEAALVTNPTDAEWGLPSTLHAPEPEAWDGRPSQRIRLLHALDAYARLGIPLRTSIRSSPGHLPDRDASRASLASERVVLMSAEGEPTALPVATLLHANPTFARVAGFLRRWQLEARALWAPWDTLVAWSEQADPPTCELPPPLAPPGEGFGWTLDLSYGCRSSVAGDVVRLRAMASGRRRLVPVADLLPHLSHPDDPVRRLAAAPLRVQHGQTGQAHARLSHYRWAQDEVVLQRIDERGQAVHLSQPLDALAAANPGAAALLDRAADEAVREVSRRLAAHAAAGGTWRLPASYRDAPGCALLPLTRWRLDPQGLPFLAQRLVRLNHDLVSTPVTLTVRDALDGLRLTADPTGSLLDDPTRDPAGGLCWILGADPEGFRVAPSPGAAEPSRCVPHGAWLRANPTLLPLLHRWLPDLGAWSEDPDLRDALVGALTVADVPAIRDSLAVPVPELGDPYARMIAQELLERPERSVPSRFRGRFGRWWRWVGLTRDARLRFISDHGSARFPALPGPDLDALHLCEALPTRSLALTGSQLTFAHPALARAIVAWQECQGAITSHRPPLDRADQVSRLVHDAAEALSSRIRRTKDHIRLANRLGEDHTKVARIEASVAHMDANLDALRRGKALNLRLEQGAFHASGAGLAVGNDAQGQVRFGDDRLRVEDGILSPALGRLRVFLVAGGEPDHVEASGPLIDSMLAQLTDKLGWALHLAADLDDARTRGTQAIIEAGEGIDHAMPYANLIAAVEHTASGTWLLWWCGTAGAWRFDQARGRLTRLTFPHNLVGLAQQAWACGLDPAAAVAVPLQLLLRRTTRHELEDLAEDEIVSFANKIADKERWTAARAGLGGAREAMREEHARLSALMEQLNHASGGGLRLDPITRGAELVFSRVYTPHEAERLILASDGFTQLCDTSMSYVMRALRRPDPQRAVAWLCAPPQNEETPTDDLAVAVIDTRPVRPWTPTHSRRKSDVYLRTTDQTQLLDGGVVPPLPDGSLPALRFVPSRLGRYYGEISDLIRDKRLPDPSADPQGYVLGVARYVQRRVPERNAVHREGEPVRDLHEVFDERNDDPLDDTLIAAFLLRRRGVDALYQTGLRGVSLGGNLDVADTCWLRVALGNTPLILDLGLPRPLLVDADKATRARAPYAPSTLGRAIGRVGSVEYWPDAEVIVELPDPDPLLDPDPWERLAISRPTPLEARSPRPSTSSPPRRAPSPDAQRAPTPSAPDASAPPAESGWLSLDDL